MSFLWFEWVARAGCQAPPPDALVCVYLDASRERGISLDTVQDLRKVDALEAQVKELEAKLEQVQKVAAQLNSQVDRCAPQGFNSGIKGSSWDRTSSSPGPRFRIGSACGPPVQRRTSCRTPPLMFIFI